MLFSNFFSISTIYCLQYPSDSGDLKRAHQIFHLLSQKCKCTCALRNTIICTAYVMEYDLHLCLRITYRYVGGVKVKI